MIKLEEQNGQVMLQEYQKKVLNGKFRTTRPVGKPTKRWEDVIQRKTSWILGRQGWRNQQEPRVEWRPLLRQARAQ